ncbi:hypothetical protein [Methylovirgula sp. HY1]|uniref:hypothetical protein n=1 Tax=Methylovirgula sp. HY1 TaxID=2822761 RepID=UPI001C5B6B13|nr:hypothetical protein [Methylovirgula sp. HY1]QXX74052.1 hypothetical protein MHY1_00858 [Methylovirgula sp. HY1]
MKVLAAAAVLGLFFAGPVAAQDKPPTTGHESSKDVLARCRDSVATQGLDAHARRMAIAACILQSSPDLTARINCLMDSRMKDKDPKGRMAFLKNCSEGKK